MANQQNATWQLPVRCQRHLDALPQVLSQLLVYQDREQPGLDPGAIRPTTKLWTSCSGSDSALTAASSAIATLPNCESMVAQLSTERLGAPRFCRVRLICTIG